MAENTLPLDDDFGVLPIAGIKEMTLTTGISRSRKMDLWSQNRYKDLPTPFDFCGWIRNSKEEEQASEGSPPVPYHASM